MTPELFDHIPRSPIWGLLPVFCLTGLLVSMATPANACGGLFCNSSSPVNQTAERILFVDHGDGRTTAVIQIQYQGSADRFAWVLPVPDIENPDEDIRVSSDVALERLQAATNPQYTLNTTVEGTCKNEVDFALRGNSTSGGAAVPGAKLAEADSGGIVVEASGTVGPFDYEFISVIPGTEDPTQAATDWLEANDYDLAGGEELLRPYLEIGLKLLAVRLTSGVDVGSIRPLMITYKGSKPSIPIRPTAVAAQDNMGVMVFVAGPYRAIPRNYMLLELNEAMIDWFNVATTYGDAVNRAADEASGHGFVTEYADETSTLEGIISPAWERDQWREFQNSTDAVASDADFLNQSGQWSNLDGFADAVATAVTLPTSVSVTDVMQCPSCYLDGADERITFDRQAFLTALYEMVLRPMFDTEALLQEQRYVTRLYTTMSANEMTEDPMFDFNPDMGAVSNLHTAEQIIMCSPDVERFEAPFRIELESGDVLFGNEQGVWPIDVTSDVLPATRRISQAGISGEPVVVIDNIELIELELSISNEENGFGQSQPAVDCGCRAVGISAGSQSDDGGAYGLAALACFPLALLWVRRRSRANI